MHPFKIYVTVTNLTCIHMETHYLRRLCCVFLPRSSM